MNKTELKRALDNLERAEEFVEVYIKMAGHRYFAIDKISVDSDGDVIIEVF